MLFHHISHKGSVSRWCAATETTVHQPNEPLSILILVTLTLSQLQLCVLKHKIQVANTLSAAVLQHFRPQCIVQMDIDPLNPIWY